MCKNTHTQKVSKIPHEVMTFFFDVFHIYFQCYTFLDRCGIVPSNSIHLIKRFHFFTVTNGQAWSSFCVLNSLHMITCSRITRLVWGLRVCHSLLDMFAKSPSWTPGLFGSQATSFPASPPPRHAVPFSCVLPFMCRSTQAVASLIVGRKRRCFFVNDLFLGDVL